MPFIKKTLPLAIIASLAAPSHAHAESRAFIGLTTDGSWDRPLTGMGIPANLPHLQTDEKPLLIQVSAISNKGAHFNEYGANNEIVNYTWAIHKQNSSGGISASIIMENNGSSGLYNCENFSMNVEPAASDKEKVTLDCAFSDTGVMPQTAFFEKWDHGFVAFSAGSIPFDLFADGRNSAMFSNARLTHFKQSFIVETGYDNAKPLAEQMSIKQNTLDITRQFSEISFYHFQMDTMSWNLFNNQQTIYSVKQILPDAYFVLPEYVAMDNSSPPESADNEFLFNLTLPASDALLSASEKAQKYRVDFTAEDLDGKSYSLDTIANFDTNQFKVTYPDELPSGLMAIRATLTEKATTKSVTQQFGYYVDMKLPLLSNSTNRIVDDKINKISSYNTQVYSLSAAEKGTYTLLKSNGYLVMGLNNNSLPAGDHTYYLDARIRTYSTHCPTTRYTISGAGADQVFTVDHSGANNVFVRKELGVVRLNPSATIKVDVQGCGKTAAIDSLYLYE